MNDHMPRPRLKCFSCGGVGDLLVTHHRTCPTDDPDVREVGTKCDACIDGDCHRCRRHPSDECCCEHYFDGENSQSSAVEVPANPERRETPSVPASDTPGAPE